MARFKTLFVNAESGTPETAFLKINSPSDFTAIQALVEQGYMVRTRADGDTKEAHSGDTTRRDQALESGAQFVSTDYPVPDPRSTDYSVSIPGDNIARCNLVNMDPECIDSDL